MGSLSPLVMEKLYGRMDQVKGLKISPESVMRFLRLFKKKWLKKPENKEKQRDQTPNIVCLPDQAAKMGVQKGQEKSAVKQINETVKEGSDKGCETNWGDNTGSGVPGTL